MNNFDYHITVAHGEGSTCDAASELLVLKVDVLKPGKMVHNKNLSNRSQIVMTTVKAFPKLQVLLSVPGLQCSVPTKRGLKNGRRKKKEVNWHIFWDPTEEL